MSLEPRNGSCSDERRAYRNGYRERELTTRVGKLRLMVPRIRNGEFSTDLFLRYQRSEQALVLSMMEMVIQGVSTRKVRAITEELCWANLHTFPELAFFRLHGCAKAHQPFKEATMLKSAHLIAGVHIRSDRRNDDHTLD